MANVIIRVELRGDPGGDIYKQLHEYMGKKNWHLKIDASDGLAQLPHAMYCGTTKNKLAGVAEALTNSISSEIWKKVIVMVIEWNDWAMLSS